MCLYRIGCLKTAKKDIPVLKVLIEDSNGNLFTYFRKVKVPENRILTPAGRIDYGKIGRCITRGFIHAYTKNRVFERKYPLENTLGLKCRIFRAVIPKGTKYISGYSCEVAARKLIIKSETTKYKLRTVEKQ